MSNYDGSQDEGDRQNDDVLREFFAPFAGSDPTAWPKNEVRLIAINEGRLVDFLTSEGRGFEALAGGGCARSRVGHPGEPRGCRQSEPTEHRSRCT